MPYEQGCRYRLFLKSCSRGMTSCQLGTLGLAAVLELRGQPHSVIAYKWDD